MDLYWLDLETAGLDPREDAILEIAIYKSVLADPFNVHPVYNRVLKYDKWLRRNLNQFVLDMHTKNGLLEECAHSNVYNIDAEKALLELVPTVENPKNKPILAGNSVHFDHGFIREQMPQLDKRFSYRHYDVSSVFLFCQSLGMPKPDRVEAHRAQADVLASVELAKKCAAWILADRIGKRA